MHEAKQQALDMDERSRTGATQFVADTAKEGVRKATEMADTVADTAKKTMDGAWKASREANEKIRERVVGDNSNSNRNNEEDLVVVEVEKIDGTVDTVEYRNIEMN
ncbi:uncharacterized protein LOC131173864 [Hevea brasiliensis]|uniref:uncharacterized protein LOC131173864 n=1 Tax=Hevea brasiliensis TaxID=3981 RepID=UPI0025EA3010|nr:uncharacterized protein LOC131173864 [Hevea brasiliensis]